MKLELLNSENLSSVTGGGLKECHGPGDTIFKECFPMVKNVIIKWCTTYESNCVGTFSYSCMQQQDIICSIIHSVLPSSTTISH